MRSNIEQQIPSKNFVASLAKGLKVLESFNESKPELTLSEIGGTAKFDSGTTFRLVRTLLYLGYLEKVENSKRFRLSLKVCELGFNAIGRMEMREIIRPLLRKLVDEINEAASFGILDGTDVVYIDRVQAGLVRLGVDIKIGSRIPSYYTAIGLSIIAFLPKKEARYLLETQKRIMITSTTVINLNEIEVILSKIRERLWSYSEPVPALRVLASPVLDKDDYPIGAISVAGLSTSVSKEIFFEKTLNPLLETAKKLSLALSISGVSK